MVFDRKSTNLFEYLTELDENLTPSKTETVFVNQTGVYLNFKQKKLAIYETSTGLLSITCDFTKIRVHDDTQCKKYKKNTKNITEDDIDSAALSLDLQLNNNIDVFKKFEITKKIKKLQDKSKQPDYFDIPLNQSDTMKDALKNKRQYEDLLNDTPKQFDERFKKRFLLNEKIKIKNAFRMGTWWGFKKDEGLTNIFLSLEIDPAKALLHDDFETIIDIETYTYHKDILFDICEHTGSRQIIRFLKNSSEMNSKTTLLPRCEDERLVNTIQDINKGFMTMRKLKKQLLQFASCINKRKFKTVLLVRLMNLIN